MHDEIHDLQSSTILLMCSANETQGRRGEGGTIYRGRQSRKGQVALMVVKAIPTGIWGWRSQRNILLGRPRIRWESKSKSDLKIDAAWGAWAGLIWLSFLAT